MNIENKANTHVKVLVTTVPRVFIFSQNKQIFCEGYHKLKSGIDARFYVITNYEDDLVVFLKIAKLKDIPILLDNSFFNSLK
jgi:hypothetical protein